jgi:release factor glutamine methyltransferase
MTVKALLEQGTAALAQALGFSRAEALMEARLLLGRVLERDRAWLMAHESDAVASAAAARFDAWVARRAGGEPVAYIVGEREFFGHVFRVAPAVLIPRPETELLVERALARLPVNGAVLDLGAGSGAVAVSLALARPDAEVVAVDRSSAALAVARENAARLGARVEFLDSDWFSALGGRRFDLIVSNPPYVASGDPHLRRGDVRFEPLSALAAGPDGLDDIRRIVAQARAHLNPGGWLLFEHGFDQADICQALLREADFCQAQSWEDLSGIKRITGGAVPPL